MMSTELLRGNSKSDKKLSVFDEARGKKTKATKATLAKKGGKKNTGSDSPKKMSASSPKKMSASSLNKMSAFSPKTETLRKAGRKK